MYEALIICFLYLNKCKIIAALIYLWVIKYENFTTDTNNIIST